MTIKVKKRNFSSFTYTEAFKYLKIKDISPWSLTVSPLEPSDFFHERMRRLGEVFALQNCEDSKKLVIDAILLKIYPKFWET